MGKICKLNEIPKSFSDINIDDIFTQKKLLPVKNIHVNDEIQKKMSERTLNSLLTVKDTLMHYNNKP